MCVLEDFLVPMAYTSKWMSEQPTLISLSLSILEEKGVSSYFRENTSDTRVATGEHTSQMVRETNPCLSALLFLVSLGFCIENLKVIIVMTSLPFPILCLFVGSL